MAKETKKPALQLQDKPASESPALGVVMGVRKLMDEEAEKMAKDRLEEEKLTIEDLIIPKLRLLRGGHEHGASKFAAESNDFERTFVYNPEGNTYSQLCNYNTPTKTITLTKSNLHIYKEKALSFSKKLENTARTYSGIEIKPITDCTDRFIDALEAVLAADPNAHGKVIEAIINGMLNNNFANYDLAVYGISDQLAEVLNHMHIPRAFSHPGDSSGGAYDYNSVRHVLGNPSYFTGYCPKYSEVLSADHYLVEAASAYIALNNETSRFRCSEILTHKRKMFVSTILHFSRVGKIDTILLRRILADYMFTLRGFVSSAIYSIRNITKQLSEINWLTSVYMFDDYDDFLLSRLSSELARNPVVGSRNTHDDMPF